MTSDLSFVSETKTSLKDLPKWQLALLLGLPTVAALSFCYWYFGSNSDSSKVKTKGKKAKGNAKKRNATAAAPSLSPIMQEVMDMKKQGNERFTGKPPNYEDALQFYSRAIDKCPASEGEQLSILYQNRAACHEKLGNQTALLADVNSSLSIQPKYVKALLRRAKVHESLGNFFASMVDFASVELIDSKHKAGPLFSQVLTKYCENECNKILSTAKPIKLRYSTLRDQQVEFQDCPVLALLKGPSSIVKSVGRTPEAARPEDGAGDSLAATLEDGEVIGQANGTHTAVAQNGDSSEALTTLQRITDHFKAQRYDEAMLACEYFLANTAPLTETYFFIQLILATLTSLCRNFSKAEPLLRELISSKNHPGMTETVFQYSVARLCQLKTWLGDHQTALDLIESHLPGCTVPDVIFQKSNALIFSEKVELGIRELDTISSKHACANAKHTVFLFLSTGTGLGQIAKLYDENPDVPEFAVFYSQTCLQGGDFKKAEEILVAARKSNPQHASLLVHLGILALQASQDVNKAKEYCDQAIAMDPDCQPAYEIMSSMACQMGQIDRAIDLMQKSAEKCRSMSDMQRVLHTSGQIRAQIEAAKNMKIDLTPEMLGQSLNQF